MATLLIRNLDDFVKAALRKRAAANGRSMEEEARVILSAQLRRVPTSREGLGTRLRRIFEEHGVVGELEIPPRSSYPFNPQVFHVDADDEDK
ncbi:MAG: plasmid stabilization protein [Cyanobacteria bacterium]|nr:plasmid stabilization protein [Cyanobacteriota bacterium]